MRQLILSCCLLSAAHADLAADFGACKDAFAATRFEEALQLCESVRARAARSGNDRALAPALFYLARTQEALRRYPEAVRSYTRFLALPAADRQPAAEKKARDRLELLRENHFGELRVECPGEPAVEVELSNTGRRPCPARFEGVLAGSASLVSRVDGATVERRTAEVQPGGPTTVRLGPYALLEVQADVPARVMVDGEARGVTPARLWLVPGRHEVRLTAPRHRAVVEVVEVGPDAPARLDLVLPAEPNDALGWTLVAVGAVAIAGGLAATWFAIDSQASIDDPVLAEKKDKNTDTRNLNIAFAAAGLLGGGGALTWGVMMLSDTAGPSAQAPIGPTLRVTW